jgi:mannonate dehydratase
MHIVGIKSVNVYDAIKAGTPERDALIDNYIQTLENLGQENIHLVCYSFMPIFDCTRTELARKRPDGSTVLAYTQKAVDAIDPGNMFSSTSGDMNGTGDTP